jgi:protein-disulfide isomerase
MEQSSSNPWFAISTGLVGLIVGYGLSTAVAGTPSPSVPSVPSAPSVVADDTTVPAGDPADVDDDAVKGDPNATVTLIEFTDYECPFCGRHFTDTLPDIMKNYVDTGKVKYVVRDYPLSFHPGAQKAAEASECAGEQDKFWEMHDKLFSTQGSWGSDHVASFKKYATELGLNATAFNTCLDSGAMAAEVNADLSAGSAAGISGTPGFWIVSDDGQSQSVSGAYPYATFQAAFDSML